MELPSVLSHATEPRARGIALSSALLAAPVLLAGYPRAGAVLLAAAAVAAAVFVERRAQVAPRSLERSSRGLTLVSLPPPSRRAHPAPQARWEIVERDGKRSLSMRWS